MNELLARDREARRLAQTEFERPLLLEAGAGTGKTATLVARIVAWCVGPGWERHADLGTVLDRNFLSSDRGPSPSSDATAARVLDRVAAITFTEAAASEMAEKIASALGELAHDTLPVGADAEALPAPELRRARAHALLPHLDRLVVCTIHAFCRRLLAAYPLEAGLHPAFSVDADGAATGAVVREAIEAVLNQAYAEPGDPDLLQLAEWGTGPRELEELLLRAVQSPLTAQVLERDPFPPDAIEAFFARGRAGFVELRAAEDGRLATLSGRARKAHAADEALHSLEQRLQSLPATRLGLEALAEALAVHTDHFREKVRDWAAGKLGVEEAQRLGERAEAFQAAAAALRPWLEQARGLAPERLDTARRALAPLLAEVEHQLLARGIASYDDLLSHTRALLRSHETVRARIAADLDQLLIDEFQDTDAVQCDIARALALDAAGPVLFVVGDPKQSIYGWRRADLAAYESFAEEIERAGGSRHTLHRNFRSRPLILDEVNRALEPVMRYERGLQPHYEPLVPDREAGADHCPVELWVSWTRDSNTGECRRPRAAEAAELEAAAVAADIARLRRAGVDLQEVAVLMRSRGDLDSYLEALRDAQLPFSVEGDRSYYQRREIIEVAALVRCIVNPNDHLSLLAWLRSASVGLPDAALVPMWARDFPAHASRLRAPDEAALADLRDIVTQAAESLSPDIPGLGRIAGWEHGVIAALETLAVLRRSFEADSPDVFVETLRTRTLVEATEAARYLGRYRAANLERFFAGLIDDLVRGGGDARAVARSLRRRIREAEDEEEAPVRHADEQAVQVLTIHQAKGLDFEHVYLVQAHREGRRDDPALLCGEVDGSVEYRLCEGSTLGFEALRAQRRRVAQAEQVRTLYVGLTRAKERLVVCGNWPAGDERRPPEDARHYVDLLMWRDAPRPELGALFNDPKSARGLESGGVLWRFPARGGAPKPGRPAVQTPALPSRDAVAADATRIAARRRTAAREMERPFRGTASNLQAEPERKFAATGASVAAAAGIALHGILEHFDPDAEPEAERARHRAELGARLETLVAPAELSAALERGTDLLERLHSGPLLDRLRALGSAAARELPILAPPSRAVGYTAGVIDLLYADPETGEWVVADYKSDAVESEAEIRALAGTYAAQGAVYTEAVRAALELDAPPRFELWLLHAGRILPVPAATLAAP